MYAPNNLATHRNCQRSHDMDFGSKNAGKIATQLKCFLRRVMASL